MLNAQTSETQAAMTPESSLQALKDGNQRFVNKQGAERDLMTQVSQT